MPQRLGVTQFYRIHQAKKGNTSNATLDNPDRTSTPFKTISASEGLPSGELPRVLGSYNTKQ